MATIDNMPPVMRGENTTALCDAMDNAFSAFGEALYGIFQRDSLLAATFNCQCMNMETMLTFYFGGEWHVETSTDSALDSFLLYERNEEETPAHDVRLPRRVNGAIEVSEASPELALIHPRAAYIGANTDILVMNGGTPLSGEALAQAHELIKRYKTAGKTYQIINV